MTKTEIICEKCKHFVKFYKGGCAAFSDIPREILEGKNKHKRPLKNQKNNLVFEPLESE